MCGALQVEVFESRGGGASPMGRVLGRELAGAMLLHRHHIEGVNEELLSRGEAKVGDVMADDAPRPQC